MRTEAKSLGLKKRELDLVKNLPNFGIGFEVELEMQELAYGYEGSRGRKPRGLGRESYKNLAIKFSKYLEFKGMDFKAISDSEHPDYAVFNIVDDNSLVKGVEIVSPIFKDWKTFKSGLIHTFDFFKSEDYVASKRTGLHIGISFKGIQHVRMLKTVMLFPEIHVGNKFERTNNGFAKIISNELKKLISSDLSVKDSGLTGRLNDFNVVHIEDQLEYFLRNNERYFSFNFHKLKDGYVEFRLLGGPKYTSKIDDIINESLRAVLALYAGTNRLFEKEYLSELYSLIKGGNKSKK